jgi:hypothetical protein
VVPAPSPSRSRTAPIEHEQVMSRLAIGTCLFGVGDHVALGEG